MIVVPSVLFAPLPSPQSDASRSSQSPRCRAPDSSAPTWRAELQHSPCRQV